MMELIAREERAGPMKEKEDTWLLKATKRR